MGMEGDLQKKDFPLERKLEALLIESSELRRNKSFLFARSQAIRLSVDHWEQIERPGHRNMTRNIDATWKERSDLSNNLTIERSFDVSIVHCNHSFGNK